MAEKCFFGDCPPLSQGLNYPPPPPTLAEGVDPPLTSIADTTAVKHLIVIFIFYCWDFIYHLEKNGQRCMNQLVNITIFPFFSKF